MYIELRQRHIELYLRAVWRIRMLAHKSASLGNGCGQVTWRWQVSRSDIIIILYLSRSSKKKKHQLIRSIYSSNFFVLHITDFNKKWMSNLNLYQNITFKFANICWVNMWRFIYLLHPLETFSYKNILVNSALYTYNWYKHILN